MKKRMVLLVSLAVFGTACSSMQRQSHHTEETISSAARDVARTEDASMVTEFSFPRGSHQLNEAAKADLRRIISEAEARGDVKEIKVVTWADSEYPSQQQRKLSDAQVDLVKKRNESIRDFVKSYDSSIDVDTHSMAERPNAFKEVFRTSDARIKRSLEQAGIPHSDSDIKNRPRASKSIIMAVTE